MKTVISTDKAPAAIGPYSQAISINGFVYTSGVIPINPIDNTLVSGGVIEQTRQVLNNMKALLEESGSNMGNVVKTTVFIKDMNDFSQINEIYAEYFIEKFPSRSCVEVARLPKDVLIEIEAIAVLV